MNDLDRKMARATRGVEDSNDRSETARLRERCKSLNVTTWLARDEDYKSSILPVWEENSIPLVLDKGNNSVSNFQFLSGESKFNQLVITTESHELENEYSNLYEAMHDAVVAMVSLSPRLKKLDSTMMYSQTKLLDVVSVAGQRLVTTALGMKDKTGRCVQDLGERDNVLNIIRTVDHLKMHLLAIHRSLLNNKPLRIGNFTEYQGFYLPDNESYTDSSITDREFYSPMFKRPGGIEKKYEKYDLKMLASFLDDMTFVLNQVDGVLKKHPQ